MCGFPSSEGGDQDAVPSTAAPPAERHFHSELSNFQHISPFWSSEVCWEPECGRLRNSRRMSSFTDSRSEPFFLRLTLCSWQSRERGDWKDSSFCGQKIHAFRHRFAFRPCCNQSTFVACSCCQDSFGYSASHTPRFVSVDVCFAASFRFSPT